MGSAGKNTSGDLYQTSLTTNGVLYSAASGVVTSTAAGTSGQVLTSNGSGSAPTYQTASSGAWTLISLQSASNSASVSFTSGINSTYSTYAILFQNVDNIDNNTFLVLQMSTDGGSTYITTSYNSMCGIMTDTGGVSASTATGHALVHTYQDNGASCNGSIYLTQLSTTNLNKRWWGQSSGFYAGLGTITWSGGYQPTTSVVNAVKLFFTTGNINTGDFRLYGIS